MSIVSSSTMYLLMPFFYLGRFDCAYGDTGGHLEFFQQLDHATQMLNHPGQSLIFQVDFLDMINRIDVCIEFLKSHVCPSVVAFKSFVLIIFAAILSRSRSLSTPIPAMHDPRYDTNQDEFRRVTTRPLL